MELQPASIDQVRLDSGGNRIVVDRDVGEIVSQIQQISPKLQVHWRPKAEIFAVVEVEERPDGRTRIGLVTTATELDARLLERIRKITHPSYDYVAEAERIDRQADREKDHIFSERLGEGAEKAAHGLRKDLGYKSRMFVKKDLDGNSA